MKIAMILSTFPPVIGGAGSVAFELSKILVKQGHKIDVFTQQYPNTSKTEVKQGIRIIRIKTPITEGKKGVFNYLKSAVILSRLIKKHNKKEKYDILHAHEITVGGMACYLANISKKTKGVIKYGGDMVYEVLGMLKPGNWNPKKGYLASWKHRSMVSKITYLAQKKMLDNYTKIYANNEYGYILLKKYVGISGKKLSVIRNAVNTREFRPGVKCNDIIKKYGNKMIFSAARLVPWKGTDTLIKAVSGMKGVSLVIAGLGNEEKRLKSIAGENVHFVGKVSREQMPKYYNACKVYVQPSYFDPNPNSVLEAMSCAKPVIASGINTVREIINNGKTGLLFKAGDSKELKLEINRLLKNPNLRKSIGKKARDMIVRRHGFEVFYRKIKELYNNII